MSCEAPAHQIIEHFLTVDIVVRAVPEDSTAKAVISYPFTGAWSSCLLARIAHCLDAGISHLVLHVVEQMCVGTWKSFAFPILQTFRSALLPLSQAMRCAACCAAGGGGPARGRCGCPCACPRVGDRYACAAGDSMARRNLPLFVNRCRRQKTFRILSSVPADDARLRPTSFPARTLCSQVHHFQSLIA